MFPPSFANAGSLESSIPAPEAEEQGLNLLGVGRTAPAYATEPNCAQLRPLSARHLGPMAFVDQTPVRVLVVDDSEVFRNVMCAVVAAAPGFEVVGDASSGREALALIDVLDPHLLLLDLYMPELDGLATALDIRRKHPDVVVLLLTAARRAHVADKWLRVEDKRDLSPQWLADFWRRHGLPRH
jgi:CheY-like chemotaxis protein